ncbi:ribonuclease HII [uncultured Victivallis sp.]|uniref:ribonuclease HII n=1 Tax=uncultured Victivallis sp. TaxID=354118 RepID=UPI00258DC0B9|nr:ribonuclease HII [uncultured Victivallis sp.]
MDGFLTETDELLRLERECRAEGFCFVAGVDEVGRGPLAGPVVAAAVVFPRGAALPPVNDSKQLTELERETLRDAIYAVPGIQIGIGEIDVETIDRMNILNATHLAMRRAVEQLKQADFILVDGRPVKGLPLPSRAIVKGDAKSASIAAASIVAKVYRDRLMVKLDAEYPGYGFASHKGYGTAMHLEALKRLGVTPVHRRSFRPVREIIDPPPEQPTLF